MWGGSYSGFDDAIEMKVPGDENCCFWREFITGSVCVLGVGLVGGWGWGQNVLLLLSMQQLYC